MVVKGRSVASVADLSQPGDFFIETDVTENANMFYRCPCGCAGRHEFSSGRFELIRIATGPKKDGYWQWDGNKEQPTLSPSIWSRADRGGCGWHGYLRSGNWESC